MGKARVECRYDVGEGGGHEGVERADLYRAGQLRFLRGEDLCAGNGADDVARVGDEVLAVLRDGDVFSDAVEKTHAKFSLQLLDLHGDGRLGVVQRIGSLGKAVQLGDLQKCDKIANLHR